MPNVGVFTSVCEADARWLDQYLAEVTRLGFPFAMYFDRCSPATVARVSSHALFFGGDRQDDLRRDYQECHKQATLDRVAAAGFRWAMSWDVDETWERDAPAKVQGLLDGAVGVDIVGVRWVCLWGDAAHARVDGPFAPGGSNYRRDRFYRLDSGLTWRFIGPTVYGPYPHHDGARVKVQAEDVDLACLHWGYMTRELRELHKRRWDHNYGTALGQANPYQLWQFMLDEVRNPPTVEEHAHG